MNPYLKTSGKADTLTANQDRSACRQALGLPPQAVIHVNFRTYNVTCRQFSLTAFDSALYRHEAFGTNGINANANGHESRRRYSAGQPNNDPRKAIESIVTFSEAFQRSTVRIKLDEVDRRISSYATDHGFVRNNYLVNGACGKTWVLDTSQTPPRYLQVAMQNGVNCM